MIIQLYILITLTLIMDLERGVVLADGYQIALALGEPSSARSVYPKVTTYLKDLSDICLLAQHKSTSLISYVGQLPPSLKILCLPFVSMCNFCVLPMALRKGD